MKALKLIVFGIVLFFAGAAQGQISVRLNLGIQPRWAPVGYDDVRYYYLPDVEAYYDNESSMFIYLSAGRWIHRRALPSRYRNYDLYEGYKVPIREYRGNTPYSNYNVHRTQYVKGYRGEPQRTIGERPGNNNGHNTRYSNSDNNKYSSHPSDNGNDKGQGRDNGKDNKKDKGRGK